jgi:hypothetical protein
MTVLRAIIMLSVIFLTVMLIVLMLSVIMLNVMAPLFNENLIIYCSIVLNAKKSFSKAGNHKCLNLFDTHHKFVIYD